MVRVVPALMLPLHTFDWPLMSVVVAEMNPVVARFWIPALPEATSRVTDEPPRADCCKAGPASAPSPWTQQFTELTSMLTEWVPPLTPTEVPLMSPSPL